MDGAAKATHWGVPPESINTWQFGLDRLYLGFARPEKFGTWESTLPFDLVPAEAELAGMLGQLIHRLGFYRDEFACPRSFVDWHKLLTSMLEEFFEPRQDEVLDLTMIIKGLESITRAADLGDYSAPVSFDLVRQLVNNFLNNADSQAGFIAGGITFATLVPMRSIPFKVVCLLGMNDGEYPRDRRPHSFDLMSIKGPQKGDRSRRLDDRYLFLEALLSAEQIFYVSYVGRGVRDNQNKPPSVVVTEWLTYLTSIFESFEVQFYPLQPFSPRHYQGGKLQSYSTTWYAADEPLKIETRKQQKFIDRPLLRDESLVCGSLTQLEQFYRHSARYFLQQRLGIYFDQDDIELKDTESFSLDNLERYEIADNALQALVTGADMAEWRRNIEASGKILTGVIGAGQVEQALDRAGGIYEALLAYVDTHPERLEGSVTFSKGPVYFQLDNIHNNLLLNYRVGKLTGRHLTTTFLRHLFAGAAGHSLETVCIAAEGKNKVVVLRLAQIDQATCIDLLEKRLRLYEQGTVTPLLLAPETTRIYAEAIRGGDDITRARERTMSMWQGQMPGAEGTDPYWTRLFNLPDDLDEHFAENAINLWSPLLDIMEKAK